MTMEMEVIITAPHAHCDPTTNLRTCDTLSKIAAFLLDRELKQRGVKTEIHIGDTFRGLQGQDLNRDETLDFPFRKRLTASFQRNRGNIFLLDVHSYPPTKNYQYVAYMLVITASGYQLATNLSDWLSKKGLPTTVYEGGQMNSIIVEALSLGISGILLEFNEDLGEEVLKNLVESIADWVKEMITK